EQVLGEHVSGRHAVEERGLAGVRVADERHDRVRHAPSAGAMQSPGLGDALQIALDPGHPFLGQPAIGLDLRLPRAAEEAEPSALALEMRPGANQAALLIVEMGELDLKGALARARATAEYLQD